MRYDFDDAFLDELRSRNDIETVIGEYMDLRRRGHVLTGLCPFHNEKTPSFTVYPDTQSFYCFGCGAGGEIITFTRKFYNLDFVEAVKQLADRAGMALPISAGGGGSGVESLRRLVLEANRAAARFYNELLYKPEGEAYLDYLRNRGIDDRTITAFGLGAAPDAWHTLFDHLRAKGFANDILVSANLVKKTERNNITSYYDMFRNKIIFPVIDVRGNVIAFGSRVIDNSKPKYINSSDTPVYKKSNELYALNIAKNGNEGKLILCEGYMDVIALHGAGFTNAVAGLGTALTPSQVSVISRYAKEVMLCYDSDEAGKQATAKALSLFSQTGVKTKVINLTDGKDPDDIIRKQGKERFRALLEGSSNDIEYRLLTERKKHDTESADGKISYLKAAAVILAVNGGSIERDIYAARLSDELGVGKDAVLQQIKLVDVRNERAKQNNAVRDAEKAKRKLYEGLVPKGQNNTRAVKAEEILLANIIANPSFLKKLEDKLTGGLFTVSVYEKAFGIISKRILDGSRLDITYLSGDFTPDEMGALSRLYTPGFPISNTIKECEDCIAALIEEKENTGLGFSDVSELNDEEYRSLFNMDKNQQ